jgi:hypothetical protein
MIIWPLSTAKPYDLLLIGLRMETFADFKKSMTSGLRSLNALAHFVTIWKESRIDSSLHWNREALTPCAVSRAASCALAVFPVAFVTLPAGPAGIVDPAASFSPHQAQQFKPVLSPMETVVLAFMISLISLARCRLWESHVASAGGQWGWSWFSSCSRSPSLL